MKWETFWVVDCVSQLAHQASYHFVRARKSNDRKRDSIMKWETFWFVYRVSQLAHQASYHFGKS